MAHLRQSQTRLFSSPPSSLPSGSPRASGQDFEAYRVHSSPVLSAVSYQIGSSPAYVLEWTNVGCRRLMLNGVEELRAELLAAGRQHQESLDNQPSAVTGSLPATGQASSVDTPPLRLSHDRLFVIHGLPMELVKTLRASVDIDPAFLEAHASRRRYRPRRWRRDARWAHWEYPELLSGYSKIDGDDGSDGSDDSDDNTAPGDGKETRSESHDGLDLMNDPPVFPVSDGGEAATYCHASLWMAPQADILFVDRPIWRDPKSQVRKGRRTFSVIKPYQIRPGSDVSHLASGDVRLSSGDEIPSLEDELYEMLKDATALGDGIFGTLSALAYDHWLDFFEALGPHPRPGERHETSLLWQTAQCLEQNFDVAKFLARTDPGVSDYARNDWQSLIDRNQRRVDLSRLIAPTINLGNLGRRQGLVGDSKNRNNANTANPALRSVRTNASNEITFRDLNGDGSEGGADEAAEAANQRGLDRISYLGGILLPITVVSGIVSIGGKYGPNGSDFWVFWVAAVVSSAICMLIIYIDQVRFIEAWFESNDADSLLNRPSRLVHASTSPAAPGGRKIYAADPNGGQSMTAAGLGLPRTYTDGTDRVVVHLPETITAAAMPSRQDYQMLCDASVRPRWLVQRCTDGSQPNKAWRKKQLGWGGAMKRVVGYYRWVGPEGGVQFQTPTGVSRTGMPQNPRTNTV